MILWPLLNALAWNAIIGKIAKKEWKTALNQFFDFLRARSETRVFLAYLTTMGSLAGVLPPFLSFVLEISTQDTFIRLGGYIKDNTGYVSAFLGLLVSLSMDYVCILIICQIGKNGKCRCILLSFSYQISNLI